MHISTLIWSITYSDAKRRDQCNKINTTNMSLVDNYNLYDYINIILLSLHMRDLREFAAKGW